MLIKRNRAMLPYQDPIGASSDLRRLMREHLELVAYPDDDARWLARTETELRAAVRIVLHLAIDAPEGMPFDAEEFLARLDMGWMRRAWHGHRRELDLLSGLARKNDYSTQPTLAHFERIYMSELAPWSAEQRCVGARSCFAGELRAGADPRPGRGRPPRRQRHDRRDLPLQHRGAVTMSTNEIDQITSEASRAFSAAINYVQTWKATQRSGDRMPRSVRRQAKLLVREGWRAEMKRQRELRGRDRASGTRSPEANAVPVA